MSTSRGTINRIRELLRSSMGQRLYEDVYDKLRALLLAPEFQYKIFLARKGYSLYRAFKDVLMEDFNQNGLKVHGKIIHDKAFGLYAHELTADSKVLVVDDVILYSRTLCAFLDEILCKRYAVRPENICIYALIANEALLNRGGVNPLYIDTADCDHWRLRKCDDPSHQGYAFYMQTSLFDVAYIRVVSVKYMEAIHATTVPYESFAPVFTLRRKHWDKVFQESFLSDPYSLLEGEILAKLHPALAAGYEFKEITIFEQKSHQVRAFTLTKELGAESAIGKNIFLCIRFYINPTLGLIRIIPYVMLPAVKNPNEIYRRFLNLPGELSIEDEEFRIITEYRLFCFAIRLVYGQAFLTDVGIPLSNLEVYDNMSMETVGHLDSFLSTKPAVIRRLRAQFDALLPSIQTTSEWTIRRSVTAPHATRDLQSVIARDIFREAAAPDAEPEPLDRILSRFAWREIKDDMPPNPRRSGEPIDNLCVLAYDILKDKLKLTAAQIRATVVQLCDEARLAMHIDIDAFKSVACASRTGESAIQHHSNMTGTRDGLAYSVNIIKDQMRDLGISENDYQSELENTLQRFAAYHAKQESGYMIRHIDIKGLLNDEETASSDFRISLEFEAVKNPSTQFSLALAKFFPMYIRKRPTRQTGFDAYLQSLNIPENTQPPWLAELKRVVL